MQPIQTTVYRAFDGELFLDEEKCIDHEKAAKREEIVEILNDGIGHMCDVNFVAAVIMDNYDNIREVMEQIR